MAAVDTQTLLYPPDTSQAQSDSKSDYNSARARVKEYVARLTDRPQGDRQSGLGSPRVATSVRRATPDYKSGTWLDEDHRRERLAPVRKGWEIRAMRLNTEIAALRGHMSIGDQDTYPRQGFRAGAVSTDGVRSSGTARTEGGHGPPPSRGENSREAIQRAVQLLERLKRQRAYAVARVARLTADMTPRLEWCGTEPIPIACGCGLVGAMKRCRQFWLCGMCRAKRSPDLAMGIRRGLDASLRSETEAWGREGGRGQAPRIFLLTLTQKHSGDVSTDQQALATAWRKLYKRMHDDYGAFPYVGVWEVTPGRDALGHVHMHVAVVWRYRDWERIRAQWGAACPTSSYLDIKDRRRDRKASSPASVANYLGKYLSKGVDTDGFDARKRAEVSAAFYNQRSVLTSVRFWRKETKCCAKCKERYRLVEEETIPIIDRIAPGPIHLYFHGLEPPRT